MDERILKWLYDIKMAIDEIDGYFSKVPKNFPHYQQDTMLKRAIERDLEIIGEAVNRILNRDIGYKDKITGARGIVGLRNQVIHAYDSLSDENIWSILIKHLPMLKEEVERLIENEG
jgi:uncharacterized protein with HEPN domain